VSTTFEYSLSGCVTVALILLFVIGLVALPLVPVAISIQSSAANVQATSEGSFNDTATAIAASNNALETYVANTATAKARTPTLTPKQ
jgi:hypothetical protein